MSAQWKDCSERCMVFHISSIIRTVFLSIGFTLGAFKMWIWEPCLRTIPSKSLQMALGNAIHKQDLPKDWQPLNSSLTSKSVSLTLSWMLSYELLSLLASFHGKPKLHPSSLLNVCPTLQLHTLTNIHAISLTSPLVSQEILASKPQPFHYCPLPILITLQHVSHLDKYSDRQWDLSSLVIPLQSDWLSRVNWTLQNS
jgi:hypothetical protein